MENTNSFSTSNINQRWLENIFENLKNLENGERLAREGCISLMEYLQMTPDQRAIMLADIQYKNLRFMITEIDLLLTDVTPVVDPTKIEELRTKLVKVSQVKDVRSLFIKESYSQIKNAILKTELTDFFYKTLTFISQMRREIIIEIKHILYIDDTSKRRKQI